MLVFCNQQIQKFYPQATRRRPGEARVARTSHGLQYSSYLGADAGQKSPAIRTAGPAGVTAADDPVPSLEELTQKNGLRNCSA